MPTRPRVSAADPGLRPHHRRNPTIGCPTTWLSLQLYIWQDYDLAPAFPILARFLDHWRRELEGPLHSVRVAHRRLIRPTEWRAVDGVIEIH